MNLVAGLPDYLNVLSLAVYGFLGWLAIRQNRTLKRVDEQVSNTHDTNLRDDITRIEDKLDQVLITQASMQAFDAHVLEWMARQSK